MLSVFCSPSRYTQGKGATAALGYEMSALGLEGPALIVAGKTVISRLADIWKSSLDQAGIRHEVHRFGGECSLIEIERVKTAAPAVRSANDCRCRRRQGSRHRSSGCRRFRGTGRQLPDSRLERRAL